MNGGIWGLLGVVVGVVLTGTIALIRDSMAARHDDARQRIRFDHERDERRYGDRKSTYSAFIAEMQARRRKVEKFIEEHQVAPGDIYDVRGTPVETETALASLELFAPNDTIEAAKAYTSALWNLEWSGGTGEQLAAAASTFGELARRDLRGDSGAS